MIWKNFIRELGYTTSRLLSVIIITAVAVLIHVALSGIIYNGDRAADYYYTGQNVADYWITGTEFDRADYRDFQKVNGISELQPRIVLDAEEWGDEDIKLTLYGIADSYNINTPFIIDGDFPQNSREMMISSEFAEKRNLHIGNIYEIKIDGIDQKIQKTICALIKSPECMYHINATTLSPDFSKFGFAYMNAEALEDIWGKNLYNQICIKIAPGVSDAEIKNEINSEFGNKIIDILSLADNINAHYLVDQTDIIRMIAFIFPLIFFLVAILIMYSTMSRLIENARQSIGTMKALGYYDGNILLYYLLYSILVVLIGFIVGIIPANRFITIPIMNLLFASADLPSYQILPDKTAWAWAFIWTCIFCIGTAFIVTARALLEKPSECMRPKPPKKVRKLLMERIPVLWKRLSFSTKYIIRNIFRNKAKIFICTVGVAGCMTLILTSFAVKESMDYYLEMITTNEHKYDAVLTFDRSVTKGQYEHFGKMDIVDSIQYEMVTNAKIYSINKQETVRFTITDDIIELKLIDTYSFPILFMPEDGIIVDKDTAHKLGYSVGDTAVIKFTDDRKYYEMPIRGLSSGAKGLYAGKSYWRSLSKGFNPTSIYITTSDIDRLKNKVADFDFVSAFKTKETVTDAIVNQLTTMTAVVYILIFFGGLLALVVLYNLGIMSFYEQIRSLATLMVLGFYDKETRKLLLTENLVFTVIGIVVGMPLGVALSKMILNAVGTFTLEFSVKPFSYVLASAITMCFAIVVNMIIGNKMKNIEMLGALKSVE